MKCFQCLHLKKIIENYEPWYEMNKLNFQGSKMSVKFGAGVALLSVLEEEEVFD